ncbi:hypothetical protein D3C79_893340 [compost metagenome]
MIAEEIKRRGALSQVDDPAQVTEKGHFDQCADESDHQQRGKTRPDLAQVVHIERPYRGGRRRSRRLTEDVDELFEAAKQHENGNSCSVRPSGLVHVPVKPKVSRYVWPT